jgi:hypothetical protein
MRHGFRNRIAFAEAYFRSHSFQEQGDHAACSASDMRRVRPMLDGPSVCAEYKSIGVVEEEPPPGSIQLACRDYIVIAVGKFDLDIGMPLEDTAYRWYFL